MQHQSFQMQQHISLQRPEDVFDIKTDEIYDTTINFSALLFPHLSHAYQVCAFTVPLLEKQFMPLLSSGFQ